MQAVVIYESHWGNTAAVARAIAEGLGHGACALADRRGRPTSSWPTSSSSSRVRRSSPSRSPGATHASRSRVIRSARAPPDVSHPLLREWLDNLIPGKGWFAAFETRIWWSPRGATGTIEGKLRRPATRS